MQYGFSSTLPPPAPHPTDPESVLAVDSWGSYKDWGEMAVQDLPPQQVALAAGRQHEKVGASALRGGWGSLRTGETWQAARIPERCLCFAAEAYRYV
eukprot:scaffold16166_cov14-Tisochrysis_lutea.AAC.1